MIDLLKDLLMNVDYLRKIVNEAVTNPEVQAKNDAIQFFVEIIQQFKAYQNYLQGLGAFNKSLHEILLKQLETLKVIKLFFSRDQRVLDFQAEDLGSGKT